VSALLVAHAVRLAYSGRAALESVDLEVGAGEVVALVGPNGAGKSTLLKVLSGILAPGAGDALLEGRPVASLPRDEVARTAVYVPQSSSVPFDYTALEVVLMGRHPFGRGLLLERPDDIAAAERALERAGAADFRDRLYRELSGGERQRVVIARALAQGGRALLLDEPTSAQDLVHGLALFGLFRERAKEGCAVLIATHDLNAAAAFGDRIVVLAGGRVVRAGAPKDVVVPEVLRDVFGVACVTGVSPAGAPYAVPTGSARA
jgi:iron complex transport system ATP-binding protein